jgi:hypothetical protein
MLNIPEWIKQSIAGGVIAGSVVGIVIVAQTAVSINEQQLEQREILAHAECTPMDEGETTIQSIKDGHIDCERHAKLDYGVAQIATLQCPVKGACNADTLVSIK